MALKQYDVALVGAGVVGLSLALLLTKLGISVVLIDKNSVSIVDHDDANKLPYSSRVSAISLASQALFEDLNVWNSLLRTAPYSCMRVWEDQAFGGVSFSADELSGKYADKSHIGTIVENSVLMSALMQQVQASNITLMMSRTIESIENFQQEKKMQLSLDSGDVIDTQLIIGADGGQSVIRQFAQLPLSFWNYDHTAIVANIKTEHIHQDTAWQAFSPKGPLALLPMPDKHQCSIVWSQTTEYAQHLMDMSEEAFCKSLLAASDNQLGMMTLSTDRVAFPLKMQFARQWTADGIVLVGDAAHTIHPLAGQGANLGLLDVMCLAKQLGELKIQGKSFYTRKHLRAYERERKTDAAKVIATMEGFKQLFDGANPTKKLLRNSGLRAVNALSPVKRFFVEQATN